MERAGATLLKSDLHKAIEAQSIPEMRRILQQAQVTSTVNRQDVDGWTPFHLALHLHVAGVTRVDPPLYVRLLSLAPENISVSTPNFSGVSPLLTACRHGDPDATHLLISVPG